jgi:hypothetical protein
MIMTVIQLMLKLAELTTAGHGNRRVMISTDEGLDWWIEDAYLNPNHPANPEEVHLSYMEQ